MIVYLNMLETEADREIFEKLYEENKQLLWHIIRKVVRNEADVEDALHNCFLHLAENFSRYRDQPYDNLVKLCVVIAKNVATDIAREYQKVGDISEENVDWDEYVEDISPDVLDQVIKKYEEHLLDQAVKQLSEDERKLIFLRYVLEFKPTSIAKIYGMDYEIVRKKLHRSKNKLAKILEGEEYEGLR